MAEIKWSEKPYRGKTSLDIREALGLSNEQAIIASVALIGGVALLLFLLKKPTISQEISEEI
jgi:hypothetical protein